MKRRIYTAITWIYNGPLYVGTKQDNRFVENLHDLTTTADTKSKALSNLRHRISNSISKGPGLIILDPRCISSTGYPDDFYAEELNDVSICPNCGERLTDGGYCPVCDLGETDM